MQKQKIELALYKKENLSIFSVSLLILLVILLSFFFSYGISALSLVNYNEEIKLISVNERVEIKRYTGRGGVVFFFSKDGKTFRAICNNINGSSPQYSELCDENLMLKYIYSEKFTFLSVGSLGDGIFLSGVFKIKPNKDIIIQPVDTYFINDFIKREKNRRYVCIFFLASLLTLIIWNGFKIIILKPVKEESFKES